jgi:hypothetical protein
VERDELLEAVLGVARVGDMAQLINLQQGLRAVS